jgi:predicted site-specific integrase-resolvase
VFLDQKHMRAGLYARVSTHDQQTLPLQLAAMRDYVSKRGWKAVLEVQDIGSGASLRPKREELRKAAGGESLIGSSCGGSVAGDTHFSIYFPPCKSWHQ